MLLGTSGKADGRGYIFLFHTGRIKGDHELVVKESRKDDLLQKREPRSFSIPPSIKMIQVWAVPLIVRATNTETSKAE